MINDSCMNKLNKPLLTIPTIPPDETRFRIPIKVDVIEYYTISDGHCRTYKEGDGINGQGDKVILAPCMVSYMNLFINGVLQPIENYEVQSGIIKLKTEDVPPKGAPIILQMFKI